MLAPSLDSFPQPVREAATRSLGEAIGVSSHLGPAGQGLVDAAMQAFTDATHFALTILGAVTVISAVLIGLWAPGRDGRQLALVRRLTGGGYTGRHRAH